jgi:hypothetical protein
MALLVATAGSTPRPSGPGHGLADVAARGGGRTADAGAAAAGSSRAAVAPSDASTTTTAPDSVPSGATASGPSLLSEHPFGTAANTAPTTVPNVTTTTSVTTTTTDTTTTDPSSSTPADRMQTQGYLSPPLQPSNVYGFTGTGAMRISVVWSGNTYLTMTASCPNGSQNVGGTAAMAASLPAASGSCRATVSEPTSESTSLTYSITIGPAGG